MHARGKFTLAETLRVCTPLQVTTSGEGESKSKDGDVWDQVDRYRESNREASVIVVVGSAGSGVLNIACQIKSRLINTDQLQASSNKKGVISGTQIVIVDLTKDAVELEIASAVGMALKAKGEMSVVAIMTSTFGHVPTNEVLTTMVAKDRKSVV